MEQKQQHYTGLTDAEVLESRKKNGVNILTPPEKETFWDKVKECFKTPLIIVLMAMLAASAIAFAVWGSVLPDGIWVGTAVLGSLLVFGLVVAFFGGLEDELITILMYALILSGGIAFYQGIWGGESGWGPYLEPIGIAVAVLLATGVGFFLEQSNEKTFQSLNEVNDDTLVKVIRNNNICQVPRKDVVVGDIVLLETGEEIPADCDLLESYNLLVDESSLTGEPPCEKTANREKVSKDATYPMYRILKGCLIVEGSCVAQVIKVGDATDCGRVFVAAQVEEGDPTPLSEKLDGLASLITKASYFIAILIILGRLIRYASMMANPLYATMTVCLLFSLLVAFGVYALLNLRKEKVKDAEDDKVEKIELVQLLSFLILPIAGMVVYFSMLGFSDWPSFIKYALDSIMIAVTIIVVAVPEGLPMAVTLSLAFSMKRLMKQNTLPRTMHACETMGATSVICTDKTGTLTQNQMKVSETDFPNLTDGRLSDDTNSKLLIECIAVDTTANLDFADPQNVKSIGSPTEGAVLLWLHQQGINYLPIRERFLVIDRIPFNTELKYMATIVKSEVLNQKVLYVVGAPEILISLTDVNEEERSAYENKLLNYQNKGMRTLGFAYLPLSDDQSVIYEGHLNVSRMKMLGVVGIADPIRPEVPEAIKECTDAGIQVKIITGDASGTAKEVGRQLGLWKENDTDDNIMIGKETAKMSDDELKRRLPDVKIIARARPNDKERVVRLLKDLDMVVAVTGDGTNDAPALNVADVGLSMGSGTAVAKESSDMTILDNSFSTIANAVMWGRSLYKNIKRFILFQMTVNVAACFIVLIGAFIGTDTPLTVTQMLWVNLIMDTFAAIALASLPPTHKVMKEKPRSVNDHILKGMGKDILGVGFGFAAVLLAILLFFQHADVTSLTNIDFSWGAYNGLSPYELGLFFTIFVMLHFWYMFNAKVFMTNDSAFKLISWKSTRGFLAIVLVVFFGQVAIIEVPGLQEMFNVAEGGLKISDWIIIIASTSVVMWIGEIIRWNKRRKQPVEN